MKLEHVTKRYGKRVALEDVQLTFGEGEITAVLGESGAGKTTLLNVLSNMTEYDGTVAGAKPFSYLFQDAKLLPHLTAEGNLKLVLPKSVWGDIRPMLGRVGLSGRERSLPKTLSGGERQRVAIARAFLFPHELLLMDEPFSSLDLALKKSLIELVASLWQERRETVVFVTHDVREAVLLAHRAVVLRHGKVVGDLPIAGDPPRGFFSRSPVEEQLIRLLMGEDVPADAPPRT